MFVSKRVHFHVLFRPSVDNNTLSIFIENALESGSKQKRIHILLLWTVKNGRKRIRMKTMTENIARTCVCSLLIELTCNSIVF